MRRAKRPLPDQGRVASQEAGHAVDLGHLQRLLRPKRGHDRGQRAGQQRLAAARRARHEDVVPSGGRHLQGPLHVLLPLDVAEVHALPGHLRRLLGQAVGANGSDGAVAAQVADELRQAGHGQDVHPADERRLSEVRLRHEDLLAALLAGQRDHRKDAVGVAHQPVERELAQEEGARDVGRGLPGGEDDAHGDGQVVGRPLLANVGGGQVDRDALLGELEPGVADGGAHPLLRLLDRRVGQADDVEGGHAGGDVHLHLDQGPVEAHHGAAIHLRQHVVSPAT